MDRARGSPRDLPGKSVSPRTAGRPPKISKSTKTGPKTGPKKEPFLDQFWSPFWPQNGSKMGSKMVQDFIFWGSILGSLVFEVLELFGCLLGAFMSLWSLSWEAPGPQKPRKTEGFLRFLQMQLFGSLESLMALLVPSWLLLGPIRSQNCLQNGSKIGVKNPATH